MSTDRRASDSQGSVTTVHHGMSRRDFVRSGLGAVAASVMLPACNPILGSSGGNPRLSARPGSPTVTPTVGLTLLGLASGRDGVLYVPESYSPDTPAPLFVALHGAGGEGENWASYYDRSEERGFILLAPDSRAGTWDAIQGDFGADVDFLDLALRHTFERCRIDPTQLALAGFSDGATYSLSLGVSNGDLFSHLLGFSPGLFIPADPTVGKPLVYVSHGIRDGILPVFNSRNHIVPALRDDGYDVTYVEFDGGHEVPALVSEDALDWFQGLG
jgi:phospholipase/carboxylesterase